jgi:hypothetical protein
MEKYINESNKECYRGVELSDSFSDLEFHQPEMHFEDDRQWALHTNLGSLTVVDRMTGFGWRDTETGYRDVDGKFWLASGMFDVRESGAKTVEEAIKWVKDNANNCVGI